VNDATKSRRRMLIKAVHDAVRELAVRKLAATIDGARYTATPLDDDEPTPDEPVVMVLPTERATKGPYLDNKRPMPDEIRSYIRSSTATYLDIIDPDELWVAFAINTVSGTRHPGLGRTAAEAKVCAWVHSHWPGGTGSVQVKVLTKVPDGWTFELYPPPKPNPKMLAIRSRAIFERVRLTIPHVTVEEVQDAIMKSLPDMGGPRQ